MDKLAEVGYNYGRMDEKLKTDFGRLLRIVRTAHGLSQHKLAMKYGWLKGKEYGVTSSLIAQLEIGTRNPSRQTLDYLCRAMDATPEEADALFVATGNVLLRRGAEDVLQSIKLLLKANAILSNAAKERIVEAVREIIEEG